MHIEFAMRAAATALRGFKYRFGNEAKLHEAIGQVLTIRGLEFTHEHVAGPDRFDFLVGGNLVIEVKVDGSLGGALQQANRYLARDDVAGLLIATTCSWARHPHNLACKKPFDIVYLKRDTF